MLSSKSGVNPEAGRRAALALLCKGLLALTLAGCAASSQTVQDEGAALPAPRDVQIYYATNRAPSDAPGRYFGGQRGELSFGVAAVAIPPTHEIGREEQPSLFRFEREEDERKHISLRGVQALDQAAFMAQLGAAVNSSPNYRVMLFVHGYNVEFDEAVRRLAQFATDLKFDGPVLLFSWPSQGSLTGYAVDATNVEWSQPHLTQLLGSLLDRTPTEQLYLISHSMGNRAATRAYLNVANQLPANVLSVIRELILVAPDIDADLFRNDIAPQLQRRGVHVTLYASSGDRALMASKTFNGYPRAGDSGRGLVVVPGVETIDASVAAGGSFLGHSYFAEERQIMEDIFAVVQTGQRADQRFGLQAIDTEQGRYWTFRK